MITVIILGVAVIAVIWGLAAALSHDDPVDVAYSLGGLLAIVAVGFAAGFISIEIVGWFL